MTLQRYLSFPLQDYLIFGGFAEQGRGYKWTSGWKVDVSPLCCVIEGLREWVTLPCITE